MSVYIKNIADFLSTYYYKNICISCLQEKQNMIQLDLQLTLRDRKEDVTAFICKECYDEKFSKPIVDGEMIGYRNIPTEEIKPDKNLLKFIKELKRGLK